jgi:hypothetical protein
MVNSISQLAPPRKMAGSEISSPVMQGLPAPRYAQAVQASRLYQAKEKEHSLHPDDGGN